MLHCSKSFYLSSKILQCISDLILTKNIYLPILFLKYSTLYNHKENTVQMLRANTQVQTPETYFCTVTKYLYSLCRPGEGRAQKLGHGRTVQSQSWLPRTDFALIVSCCHPCLLKPRHSARHHGFRGLTSRV